MDRQSGRLASTWRRLRMAIGLTLIGLTAAGALLSSGAQATQPSGLKYVAGWLDGLSRATLEHALPAGQVLTVGVGVERPHPALEQALYTALYDPASAEYHHFLTPAQFTARFGVSAATQAAVRRYLTSTGAAVTSVDPTGDYWTLNGTVAQLDKLFRIRLGAYRYKHSSFFADNQPPQVPASLPILGVLGLNNVQKMKLAQTRLTSRPARAGALATAPTSGDQIAFTPQDVWSIYNAPGASALTNASGTSDPATVAASKYALGQGQKIGVFGEGETSSVVAQLRLEEASYGLPKVPVRTIQVEGGPDSAYGDNTGAPEWDIDTQSSTGMAPDVSQLDLYFAKAFFDTDVAKLFSTWASDANGPRQMNASFGECEANPLSSVGTAPVISTLPFGLGTGDTMEAVTEPVLEQATIEGRTLFSSAGDTGSGCPEVVLPVLGGGNGLVTQPVPEVGYPCDSAYVVCVGGTVLYAKGTSYPQSAQASAMASWSFTGGGSSLFIGEPSFQKGVTAIQTDCISQASGTPYSSPTVCRGVPDVATLSGDEAGDGFDVHVDGLVLGAGGTSLSSPLTMGEWARIQSAAAPAVQHRGGLGFADPTIYKQASDADSCDPNAATAVVSTATSCSGAPTYERDFFDITQTESASDATGITGVVPPGIPVGTGNGFYQPTAGWDYTTGWGSINVANFMQDVAGSTNATSAYTGVEAAATPVCSFKGVSPAGNATDSVTMQNDSAADLTGATLSAPTTKTIVATLTVPGLGNPLTSGASAINFYVAWLYNGKVYYARATDSPSGFSYASGQPSGLSYNDTSNSATTGSADTKTGVITIDVPASEVGSPPAGALLQDPQAFADVSNLAANVFLPTATDSADELASDLGDQGATDSRGVSVVVAGTPGVSCSTTTTPIASGTTKPPAGSGYTTSPTGVQLCAKSGSAPFTRISSKRFSRKGIALRGIAEAHCPRYITKVSIAVARVSGRRCRFLNARHRWGKLGSCTPRSYLPAIGTGHWRFQLKLRLPRGVYHVWEHAIDNRHGATRNSARRYVYFRIR